MLSQSLTKYLSKIHRALRLYLGYLGLSIIVWCVNKYIRTTNLSDSISEFSETFEPIISADITSITFLFQSFAVVLIIYLMILVVQGLINQNMGVVLYLALAILAAMASGENFGGGLISYSWESSLSLFVASQFEWFGGAVMVASFENFRKFNKLELATGIGLIMISVISIFIGQ